MIKEYKLTFRREPAGQMFVDDYHHLHVINNDGDEVITNDPIDIEEVHKVLLEKDSTKSQYLRLSVHFIRDPEPYKQRKLAISMYSKCGNLNPHMYIHDLVEKKCVDYIVIDKITIIDKNEDDTVESVEISFDDKSKVSDIHPYLIDEIRKLSFREQDQLVRKLKENRINKR